MTDDGTPDDGVPHPPEDALAVETYVDEQRGQWIVSIAVVFADGVVRREIGTYRSRRRAEIAASWVKRGAERDHTACQSSDAAPHAIRPEDAPDAS